jgi:SNF2 family DNA or RNA helicase
LTDIGKQWIEHKIGDITIKMDAEDYLKLPPLTINDIMVDLPKKVMTQYQEVEKDMFTKLDDGTEIEVFNRASVSNKCLQFSNGAPYVDPGKPEWTALHDEKLQALDSIVEEAAGKPILVGYTFKADAERIMKRYKHLNPVNLTKTPAAKLQGVIEDGCKGKIQLMIGHPASLGHGVDGLNDFCHIIVWFGLPWSLEHYEQLIGRIASGQRFKQPVTMHRIMSRDTIDLAVADALRRKDGDQAGLKKAIQRYRDGMIPKDGSMSFM